MVGHSGAVIDVPSYYYLSQALFTFAALTLISKVAKTLQKGNEIRLRELRKKPETNPNQKTFAARNRCSLLTRTQPYQIYIHIFDRSYPVTMQVKSQNLFLFVPGSAGAAACSVFGKRGPIQFCVVFLLCSRALLPADLQLISFWLFGSWSFSEFRAVPRPEAAFVVAAAAAALVFLFFLHTFEKAAQTEISTLTGNPIQFPMAVALQESVGAEKEDARGPHPPPLPTAGFWCWCRVRFSHLARSQAEAEAEAEAVPCLIVFRRPRSGTSTTDSSKALRSLLFCLFNLLFYVPGTLESRSTVFLGR